MSTAKHPTFRSSGYATVDFSRHLSKVSKARKVSPLKGLQKYMYDAPAGMISLAGGFPDPAYFPFASISGDILIPDSFPRTTPPEPALLSWLRGIFGSGSTEKTVHITIPKYGARKGDVDLATALQYAPATGFQPLQDFIREFTGKVFKPGYSEWTTLAHVGNTNGIHRALTTLCDPGERILVEEWTYVSALAAAQPMGVLPAPVKMDAQGMSSVDLERVLSEWDEKAQGAKKPHVLYLVPIGQNPTGSTMGTQRKQAIYDVCVKYDVIIIEDDPYYFVQEGVYSPKAERKFKESPRYVDGKDNETQFLNSLVPSFTRFDYQGRVIRLDTFSKVIAPGSRMGWFTCNPFFAERLEREGETSTQMPCGFSQAFITQLLFNHWGFTRFIRWLQGLQTQYTIRRDFFVDCIFEEFDVRPSSNSTLPSVFGTGHQIFTAYVKTQAGREELQEKKSHCKTPLFSFVPPTSGLFVWLKFHLQDDVSKYRREIDGQGIDETVWIDLTKNGLLVAPGWVFSALPEDTSAAQSPASQCELTFRLAFSYGSFEDMSSGVKILAKVLKTYVMF